MAHSNSAALDDLQQIVDRLAGSLQRSVAIDDAQGRLVAASGHFGEEDELRVWAIVHRYSDPRVMAHFKGHGIYSWTEPGRIPENPEMQFKARVCCPIRDHDILFGHLFLIDEDVTDAQIEEAVAATVQIGQVMYRRLALHEDAQRRAEVLVRKFVSPDPRTQVRAAQQARDDRLLIATDPACAVLVRVIEPNAAHAVQTDLHSAVELTTRDRFREVSPSWIRSGEAVVLLFGRATRVARDVADQLVSRLLAADHRVVAGRRRAHRDPERLSRLRR